MSSTLLFTVVCVLAFTCEACLALLSPIPDHNKKTIILPPSFTPGIAYGSLLAAIIIFVQSPSGALAVTADSYTYLRQDPKSSKALRELRNLKTLEDSRLDLCADRGKQWEQCFMFGDSSVKKGEANAIHIRRTESKDAMEGREKPKIQRPPTW